MAYRHYNIILSKIVTSVDVVVDNENSIQISTNPRNEEEDDFLEIYQQEDSQREEEIKKE